MPRLIPQPRWMRTVQVGDTIQAPYGAPRIVREVTRRQNGRLRSVTVVIRHCSWTHRCYTILNDTDLRILGYRKLQLKRKALTSEFDEKVHASIHQPAKAPYILDCCDVKGLP
jgi:hypothetical protein